MSSVGEPWQGIDCPDCGAKHTVSVSRGITKLEVVKNHE